MQAPIPTRRADAIRWALSQGCLEASGHSCRGLQNPSEPYTHAARSIDESVAEGDDRCTGDMPGHGAG